MSIALTPQLLAESVVAEYIHSISERHRPPGPEPERPQDGRAGLAAGRDDAQPIFV